MTGYFRTQEFLQIRWTSRKLILYSVVLLMSASLTSSKAIVSFQLIRYANPTHKELHGRCCEWVCWDFLQLGVCDNRFSLCIDEVGGDFESIDFCAHLKMDDFHSGNDKFTFPSSFGSFGGNPIVFDVPTYRGGIQVKMDIWDKEVFHFNPEDHVDFYKQDIYIEPSSTDTVYMTLHGRGYSKTEIAINVDCASNHYDDYCSTYCADSDDNWNGHYTCDPSTGAKICRPGYEGSQCKTDINECISSPCQNGGKCRDSLNNFTCECVEGTSGNRCQVNLNECASQPCRHQSRCIDQINGYQCQCVDGYTGPTCAIEIDECNSDPCENGATCHDRVNGYTCECQLGYEGPRCESDVNECTSMPCNNGGTCIHGVAHFSCQCLEGFTGTRCNIDIDDCQPQPCHNLGICVDLVNGYVCKCRPGFAGENCLENIDECRSGPCKNGASCHDKVNGFTCACVVGYDGDLCGNNIDECTSQSVKMAAHVWMVWLISAASVSKGLLE